MSQNEQQQQIPLENNKIIHNRRGQRTNRGRTQRGGGRTMHTYINNTIKDVSINARPERNYYLIDIANLYLNFIVMETIINQLPTRPAWPPIGYFTGLFCYILAGRLQRVSLSTNQHVFNPNEMLRYDNLIVPESIAAMIESYGEAIDVDDCILIPKVTPSLIIWLADTAHALFRQTNNAASLMVDANIDDEQLLRAYVGDDYYLSYCYSCVGSNLGIPVPLDGVLPRNRNCLFGYYTMRTQHLNGTNADRNMLNAVYVIPDAAIAANDNAFLVNGAVPVAGAGYTNGLVAAIQAVRNDNVYANAPLKPNAGAIGNLAGHSFDILPDDCETCLMQLRVKLRCRAVNQDYKGTLAPLVYGDDNNNTDFAIGKTVVRAVSKEDFLLGVVMSRRIIHVTTGGIIYNIESSNRRIVRYQTSQFPLPTIGLRSQLFTSDIIEGNIKF